MRRPTTLRPLLLDAPLGFAVGLLSLAAAQFTHWAATANLGHQGREWPGGWSHPHGGPMSGPMMGPLGGGPGWTVSWLLLLSVILVAVGVAIRRLGPLTGFVISVLAGAGYLWANGPVGATMIGPALGLLAVARAYPLRRWIGWTALLVPLVWTAFVREPYAGLTDPGLYQALVFGVALMILPAVIGLVSRNREDARRRTRELELRRSTSEERLRIARDVHDILGHSLSVINMQAGVALYLLDRRPEQATASLQAIKSTSKNALEELRATLAVFRDDAAGPDRRPVAGMQRLDELIGSFRAGGRAVDVRGAEALGPLPAAVDVAGYRIVQEALTNVARHTQQASTVVRLVQDDDRLELTIENDGGPTVVPPAHDGTGIAGMIERARAVGGTLSAGPRPGGGFRVHAVLPLRRTVADSEAAGPQPSNDTAQRLDRAAPVGLGDIGHAVDGARPVPTRTSP